MPCQSYESDADWRYEQDKKERALRDKLARIACRAMDLLEKNGLTLDNKEAQEWYKQHKIADARAVLHARKEAREKVEKEALRKSALAKLTPKERQELGVK